ncbi:ABC-type glycerol-3-phosphate transport system permease component [Microbacterium natoriense]|uniref:ABC-type glycerol-3-phosphate transport system permease component n=1 Tax=Microbacterium natoriense TaxID=284570 RepID=A0AAW8F3R0_9MICO|nr:hypothetical protein [Microbacterium natoriense]MDQ0649719.1 ABC-type glycerol-3-phosphate transport system permease component [Microbacterium natoriense]
MTGSHRIRQAILIASLILLAVPFAVPTIWMITSSFKPLAEIFRSPPALLAENPTFAAYAEAFAFQPFARQYFNSVYIAVIVTAIVMIVSSLAGYAFARIRFRGANALCSSWCSWGCSSPAR